MMENVKQEREIKRGDVYWVDLGSQNGSIQGGRRPCIVTQNDTGNKFSPTVIIAPISSQVWKCKLPTHVLIKKGECNGLNEDSFILAEQVRTINKFELLDYIGHFNMVDRINVAIEISQGTKINNRYIQIAQEKAESIKALDSFINIWLSAGRDISVIVEEVRERTLKLKDLKYWCEKCGLEINNYYNEQYIKTGSKNVRLVG